jgi:hypothetical protein
MEIIQENPYLLITDKKISLVTRTCPNIRACCKNIESIINCG